MFVICEASALTFAFVPILFKNPRVYWALWTTLLFLTCVWGAFWTNELYDLGWRAFGNRPRSVDGLIGILTFPFLHADFDHLWNNTATFFVLNLLLFYFYRGIAGRVWLLLYALSGVFLWGFADGGNHIGASGLIYGLAAFLFLSGLIRRNRLLLRVSLVVVFLYGGMVWWMLPIEEHISWEGHLSGAAAGVLLAVVFRNKGPKAESFESDRELPDEELPDWWEEPGGPGGPGGPGNEGTRERGNEGTKERGEPGGPGRPGVSHDPFGPLWRTNHTGE